jgi:glycosyltransferase involved in cell wall biosynthesis
MKQKLRLSIIIPAKNEEQALPKLLGSLRAQTLAPHEIIVADAGSTDGTRALALGFGCTVIPGGLPAVGRNAGAQIATGDWFVFLDSDVFLEPEFLESLERQIRSRGLESGTAYNIPRYVMGDKGYHSLAVRLFDRCIYFLHNVGLEFSALIRYPYATGTCMFLSRGLFRRLGGFDERIAAFEDSELAARAAKVAKHGVVKRPVVHISTRRFDKHNRLLWVFYVSLHGFVVRATMGERTHKGDYFNKTLMPRLP